MTGNRSTAHRVRQWSTGLGLAGAAAMIGLAAAAARADTSDNFIDATSAATNVTDPATLLSEASTNFADANQVLAEVPTTDVPNIVLNQVQDDDTGITYLLTLGDAENSISSFDNGELSSLVTPLFTDLDQSWLQASEGILAANTALDTAITSGAGLSAAELGVIAPDLQVMGDGFFSGIIDQTSFLLSQF